MNQQDCRSRLIAAATPLFARKGVHGTNVRELARAAGVNLSMISYHFGGKQGLYAAVLEEQFAALRQVARLAPLAIDPWEKFRQYVYRCGICFYEGAEEKFSPVTASADCGAPECPRCLNNDAEHFDRIALEDATAAHPRPESCRAAAGTMAEVRHG